MKGKKEKRYFCDWWDAIKKDKWHKQGWWLYLACLGVFIFTIPIITAILPWQGGPEPFCRKAYDEAIEILNDVAREGDGLYWGNLQKTTDKFILEYENGVYDITFFKTDSEGHTAEVYFVMENEDYTILEKTDVDEKEKQIDRQRNANKWLFISGVIFILGLFVLAIHKEIYSFSKARKRDFGIR